MVNNAGVMFLGQIDTKDLQEFSKIFDVNVTGLLNGMQIVLSDMKQRNTGTIVNIISIAGEKHFPIILLIVVLSLQYILSERI